LKESTFIKDSVFNESYDRIVLDEAHYIRNTNSKTYKALTLFDNKKSKRFIITATPIYNSIDDLYAYFRFLGIIDDRKTWNEIKSKKSITSLKKINDLVEKHSIKLKKSDVIDIKKKNIKTINIKFNTFEQEFYDALYDYSIERLKSLSIRIKNIKQIKNSNTNVLIRTMTNCIIVYILRLRQACNSPWLIMSRMERLKEATNIKEASNILRYYTQSRENISECPICFDKEDSYIINQCGHKFCKECITRLIHYCPLCRGKIEDYESIECDKIAEQENKLNPEDIMYSSKIKYIKHMIKEKIKKGEKIVITSQWVSMLDIIKRYIDPKIKSITLQGDIKIEERQKQIQKFENDSDYKVAYISMMSSAEGFTLKSANNIIIVDLWWNNSKLLQVMDRLHRIGQEKQVNVYILRIDNTIEEKMQELVNQKSNMSSLIVNKWSNKTKENEELWMKVKLISN
jgi:SNF2 family DNA or RNA helicase